MNINIRLNDFGFVFYQFLVMRIGRWAGMKRAGRLVRVDTENGIG